MTASLIDIVVNERTFNNGKRAPLETQNIVSVTCLIDNIRLLFYNVQGFLENGKVLDKHDTE